MSDWQELVESATKNGHNVAIARSSASSSAQGSYSSSEATAINSSGEVSTDSASAYSPNGTASTSAVAVSTEDGTSAEAEASSATLKANDPILGSEFNDVLVGNCGDTLTGLAGSDTFILSPSHLEVETASDNLNALSLNNAPIVTDFNANEGDQLLIIHSPVNAGDILLKAIDTDGDFIADATAILVQSLGSCLGILKNSLATSIEIALVVPNTSDSIDVALNATTT